MVWRIAIELNRWHSNGLTKFHSKNEINKSNYFACARLFNLLLFINGFFDRIELLNAFIRNFINVIDIGILIATTFAPHFCIISNFHRTCYYAQCDEWHDKQTDWDAEEEHKFAPRFIQIESCNYFCGVILHVKKNEENSKMINLNRWIHFNIHHADDEAHGKLITLWIWNANCISLLETKHLPYCKSMDNETELYYYHHLDRVSAENPCIHLSMC